MPDAPDPAGRGGPVTRWHHVARSVGEGTEFARQLRYGDHTPQPRHPRRPFEMTFSGATVDTFGVGRVHQPAPVVAPGRTDKGQVIVVTALSGRYSLTLGRDQITGVPALLPRDCTLSADMDDVEIGLLTVEHAEIARVAEEISGLDAGEFAFTGHRPLSSAGARHIATTVGYLERTLRNEEAMANTLIRAALLHHTATSCLHSYPNTHLTGDSRGGLAAAPAAVRRAVAFIEANVHRPITISDICGAARIGPRGLQAAFRRHLGGTPTGFLRQARLDRAHADLQAADPTTGATVTEIAHRWGWASGSRFAVAYRDQYGIPPGRTLRS
jgi:AraC-like DNA-binding protein